MGLRPSVALIALLWPVGLAAQDTLALDLPTIMRGPETVGRSPSGVRWTPDGAWIHFSWLPPGTDWRRSSEPYRIRARPGAVPEPVSPALQDSLAPALASGLRTRDGRRKYVGSGGDLWMVELPSGRATALTRTREGEQPEVLSADESILYFRSGDNLFARTLATGAVVQLTDIRSGTAPDTTTRRSAQERALVRDQADLLQVIRDGRWEDSVRTAQRTAREALALPVTWLGKDTRLRGLSLAPTGRHALVLTTKAAGAQAKPTIVPNYVTETGYTEDIRARAKVGEPESTQRVGVLTLATGEITWVHPVPGDSADQYGSLGERGWNDAGSHALVLADTKGYNRRVWSTIDTAGVVTVQHEVTDSAWVGGPCGFCAGWLPGTRGLWLVSEADGFAHLYTRPLGGEIRQLTRGAWEVLGAGLSDDRTQFELSTSEVSPYQRHFVLMDLDGTRRTQLTTLRGGHSVTRSPDGRFLADIHSPANLPDELYLQEARPGAEAVRLTHSPLPAWEVREWIAPEIVEVPASDGVMVPARIFRPAQMGATPNGAAVLFVHGAGYLHNVHDYWSSYFREYQFHHLLASRGYLVLDVDYRGSAGYGRDWRTAIYRHMGGRDLEDFVDASKWLTATEGIPPERIGIYGGSYGGFITLMALFTRGEYFGAGAALRSVTDWAHYNDGYTARILNEPQTDSLAYRRSSPIYFAEGLQDPLLIAHGMVDTNVHFQDVVRLAQRLIELGKTRWEMALYPVENHGFERPDSWTDEYRRILELFDRWLPEGTPARE